VGRGHRVFIAERSSLTTSDAIDRVQYSVSKEAVFGGWETMGGKGGWVFSKVAKLVKLDCDRKSGSTSDVSLFSLLLPVIARFCLLLHASACL
jgi:hypothetical protein